MLKRFFLPVIVAASCVTMASPDPAQANCAGYGRPPEQVNLEVRQRANQLKNDTNEFFGQKMIDVVGDRRITLTPAFDPFTGPAKRQILNTLKLEGSTYEVYTADGRLVSAQYDGCTRTHLLTERDRYSWYLTRPPVQMPLPMLRDALRNPGQPSWRKVNQSIHPEAERRARVKFWETVGYDKAKQGWWIAWVPEGGYFEVTVRNADGLTQLKPYLANAFRQYRYVVLASDGTPLYDTLTALNNPWLTILGKTSAPAGWRASACDRESPFLCVSRNTTLGSIELQRWQFDNYPILSREFDKRGLVPGLFTYDNPSDKAKVLEALRVVIADYYRAIERDRTRTYGKGYKVQVQPPQEVKFGSIPGLRYGFTGIDATGKIREKYVSYMGFDNELKLIVTGYDPAAQSSVFRELANLEQFEPHLKTIVENLKI